ncbi:alpha/beta fold hydrolase [uncultured Aquabacterium sp.]|uniref:alpha/beta fold hydrolase n=1 Tax=uncultured Aquabacterium sp. TaxID=158753 RepID=UPI0030CB4447
MTPFDHDLERGLRNRRSVLGDAWVDRSLSKANAFNADFQAFINRYAWHEVWGRPGLDHRTRRTLVLAITLALGRWEEFELHVRAALSGGDEASRLSVDEIKEVLIQSAIYAGVPAANTGHALALAILRELGEAPEHADLHARLAPALQPAAVPEIAHPGVGRSHFTTTAPALHFTVRGAPLGQAGQTGQTAHSAHSAHSAHPAVTRTFVLCHGLGTDHMVWDALANALVAAWPGARVVCFDLRGHGLSDAPTSACTLADLVADAHHLLDALGALGAPGGTGTASGPITWIGHGLGGTIGQALAAQSPARLAALVLAHTPATPATPASLPAPSLAALAALSTLSTPPRDGTATDATTREAQADAVMAHWFSADFRQAQAATVARWRRRLLSAPLSGLALHPVAVAAAQARPDATALTALPTLVIAGALDTDAPPTEARQHLLRHPGAALVLLPDAGHLGMLEQPALFQAAVLPWLASLAQP